MGLVRRWLERLHRKDIFDNRGGIYLSRYTVCKCRRFSVYLHEFHRSDVDKCLHDHPWSFVSVVLRGGYWEEMYPTDAESEEHPHAVSIRHFRRPGSVLFRRASTAHRIVIEPGTRPWTLVFVGRKCRGWGFHTVDGWRPWGPGFVPTCETE